MRFFVGDYLVSTHKPEDIRVCRIVYGFQHISAETVGHKVLINCVSDGSALSLSTLVQIGENLHFINKFRMMLYAVHRPCLSISSISYFPEDNTRKLRRCVQFFPDNKCAGMMLSDFSRHRIEDLILHINHNQTPPWLLPRFVLTQQTPHETSASAL